MALLDQILALEPAQYKIEDSQRDYSLVDTVVVSPILTHFPGRQRNVVYTSGSIEQIPSEIQPSFVVFALYSPEEIFDLDTNQLESLMEITGAAREMYPNAAICGVYVNQKFDRRFHNVFDSGMITSARVNDEELKEQASRVGTFNIGGQVFLDPSVFENLARYVAEEIISSSLVFRLRDAWGLNEDKPEEIDVDYS